MTIRHRIAAALAVSGLLGLGLAAPAGAVPGVRDSAFGSNGLAFARLSATRGDTLLRDAVGAGVIRQPGGRLVGAATVRVYGRGAGAPASNHVALFGMTSAGRLDRTFGSHGFVQTDLRGGSESAAALLRQPNGRLVLAGAGHGRMLLVRYTASGRLDRSFGGDGAVLVSAGTGVDSAAGLVARSGGRLLVVGQSGGRSAFVLLRSNGRVDRAFGHRGVTLVDLGPGADRLSGVVLDRAGRILASGTSGTTASVLRLTRGGSIDRSFGAGGAARVRGATGHAVALDAAGRVLLTGGDFRTGRVSSGGTRLRDGMYVARFTAAGDPDPAFGDAGVAGFAGFPDSTAMRVDSAGRAVVTGGFGLGPACASLVRLDSAGALDPAFSPPTPGPLGAENVCRPAGVFNQVFEPSVPGPDGGMSAYTGLLIDPAGRIVTVGAMGGDEFEGSDPLLARYGG